MLFPRREESLCLQKAYSRLVHLAKYITWQTTINSQLLCHPCLEVKSMMNIIGTVPLCLIKSCICTSRLTEVRDQFRVIMVSTVGKAITQIICLTWKVRIAVTWEMALFILIVGLMEGNQTTPTTQPTVTKPSNHAMVHQVSNSKWISKIKMRSFIGKWSSNLLLDRWWILLFHNLWLDLRVNQLTWVCRSRIFQTRKWLKQWMSNSIGLTLAHRKRPEEI